MHDIITQGINKQEIYLCLKCEIILNIACFIYSFCHNSTYRIKESSKMRDLPEFAFTDFNVENLIREVALCEPGKEIEALDRLGVSDAAIDLWFESGNDDAYCNLEKFRNGCKTAVEMRKILQKFDKETDIYFLAKVLAIDAWQNELEPSNQDIARILNERKEDAKEMQRRRD